MSRLSPALLGRRRHPALWWAGKTLSVIGAIALIVGAALPWVRFDVFGVAIFLPGVSLWGALTGLFGFWILTGLRASRAAPLHAFLGLAALLLGAAAQGGIGRAVVRQMLQVQINLAPINERLARVALPPIEPFASVHPPREYVGPGVLWTILGGGAVLVGALFVVGGERLRRTCKACGVLWLSGRVGEIAFCPSCGCPEGIPPVLCPSCRREPAPGDRHCVTCGTELTKTN